MQARKRRILPWTVLLAVLFVAAAVKAESWHTITSGWRPTRIVATSQGPWASSGGGLIHLDPVTREMTILNMDQGLSSNALNVVAVEPGTERLWLGFADGNLDVYDPATGQVVQRIRDFKNDTFVFTINDIAFNGRSAYVATNIGVSLMVPSDDPDIWVVRDTYRGFGSWQSPTSIRRVQSDGEYLYAGSDMGVARAKLSDNLLDAGNWDIYDLHADFGIPDSVETHVEFLDEVDGTLYAGAYFVGIYRWDGSQFNQFTSSYNAFGMTSDGQGTIYIGTSGGLYSADSSGENYQRVDDNVTPKLFDVAYQDGTVWGAVDTNLDYIGGIGYYDGTSFNLVQPNTPGGDQVLALATSPEGDIWMTARGERFTGVFHLKDGEWVPYYQGNVPGSQFTYNVSIKAIGFDNRGGTWIGSRGNGLLLIEPGENGVPGEETLSLFDIHNSPLTGSAGPSSNYVLVNGVTPDPSGGMWLANDQSYNHQLLIYVPQYWIDSQPGERDQSEWVVYGPSQGLLTNSVSNIEIDKYGRLWLGPRFPGATYPLVMFDPMGTPADPDTSTFVNFMSREGQRIDFSYINDMKMSSDGLLWLATAQGLYYVDTNVESDAMDSFHFLKVPGAIGQSISALAVDPLDQVWAGTDFGVSVLGRDRYTWIHHYTSQEGPYPTPLVENHITAITVQPGTGDVYLGTNVGTSVVTTPYRNFGREIGTIEVSPQPFIVTSGGANAMTFSSTSLVPGASVRIFTPSGHLVRQMNFAEAASQGWDGRRDDGTFVASGIYLILVTEPGGNSKAGKVAVVRK